MPDRLAVLRRIGQWRDGLGTPTIVMWCRAYAIFSVALTVFAIAWLIWRSI